jgi:serine/threonine-protein phosphatase 2A regulatory subunit A
MQEFASKVETRIIISDLLPIVRELSQDDLDSMRLFCADACVALVKVLPADEIKSQIVPVLEAGLEDSSWRVRSQLALKMPLIVKNLDDVSIGERSVLPLFAKLLIDRESEVRMVAAKYLEAVCSVYKGMLCWHPCLGHLTSCMCGLVQVWLSLLPYDVAVRVPAGSQALFDHVGPSLETLSNDTEQGVRMIMSANLVSLCNYFPREGASKLLVPLLQSLSQDESYMVRRNVIADLHLLSDSSNVILNQLVPQLLELAKDPKWRVRLAVIEKTSMLATALGQRMFERKLQNLIIVSLSDHVASVREKACEQVRTCLSVPVVVRLGQSSSSCPVVWASDALLGGQSGRDLWATLGRGAIFPRRLCYLRHSDELSASHDVPAAHTTCSRGGNRGQAG